MSNAGQPTCERCNALLPWADVDRGAGQCRQCGAPFTFKAGLSALPPAVPVTPFHAAAPLMQRSAMFPVAHPPSGVRVTRTTSVVQSGYRENARQAPAEVEVRARSIGARGFITFGITLFWNSILALFLIRGHVTAFMALHFLAGAALIYASVKQLRNGFVIKLDASGISSTQSTNAGSAREERIGLSQLTGFHCEPSTIELGTVSSGGGASRPILRNVHSVCASFADGRVTRLVIEIEKPEVAFFVAQLLARETGVLTA